MDWDLSAITDSWRFLLGGIGITLLLSAMTIASSLAVGTAVGLGRSYGGRWLRMVLTFYVDSMRAVPVLVVLVWMYFAVPLMTGVSVPPFWSAWIALTLHVAAYVAEIVRAGIASIRPGQVRAALALGMSRPQLVAKVVLPQALVRMLPAIGSVVSVTIKDTAIAATIAVPEFMNRVSTVAGESYQPVPVFTAALAVYFLMLFPATRLVDILYGRVAHLGRS
jgi:polar amino acid transport system permease protein